MIKQEFTELFEVVQQYHEQSRELGEMLHKTLLDGHSVVCFGSKLQEAYIKLLYDVSGVPTELIEKLLYEGSFSMWIGFEGEQNYLMGVATRLLEYQIKTTTTAEEKQYFKNLGYGEDSND